MRYGIITTGSRGDIQPFVALALALIRKGHTVTLVASENFREFALKFDIPFLPIAGDTESLINSPEALRLLEGGNVFKFFYHLQKVTARTTGQANLDLFRACQQFDNLIVSVLPLAVVYSIAERLQKKCAAVFLSLPPIPTREFPFHVIGVTGPPWFNRLSYRLLGLGYAIMSRQINRFRKSIGLLPDNVLKACLRSNMLSITAVSRELMQQPSDWPSNAFVSGFFYLPSSARAAAAEIPDGLQDWLTKGAQPIYIGFGSIPVPDQSRFLRALNVILDHKRVVLATGWTLFQELPVHPNLFVAKYIDHDWLLPLCSAAVIHGGIGTIAAALRSGTPLVIVSILADQPVNGRMIEKKGLGLHIPFKKLSPENLLLAIGTVEAAPVIQNCKHAAGAIRAEDGIGMAVQLIEAYFSKPE